VIPVVMRPGLFCESAQGVCPKVGLVLASVVSVALVGYLQVGILVAVVSLPADVCLGVEILVSAVSISSDVCLEIGVFALVVSLN
jgi:hypothetical protein